MSPRRPTDHNPRWTRFRVGLLALVLALIATYFGFAKDIPFTEGYRLNAVFESSNNLRPGSPVRIAGVNVGKVASIERYEDSDLTQVTMEIGEEGLPIREDATLKIRPRIFLEGNFFVDLRPGTPGAREVPDGGTIGVAQTATPVQLDELFTALQADSRADLQVLLQAYGASLMTRPTPAQETTLDPLVRGKTGAQGLNLSYRWSADALEGASIVNSGLLGTRPHDLSRMIAAIADLTTQLRTRERALQDLIVNFNTTAGAFASQSVSLQAAIRELGPTLTTANAALESLDASFPATRAFAREFTPAVLETPATVEASFPWIRQARALLAPSELGGLLDNLQPATEDLARLEGESLTFLPQLDLADRCFADTIIPAGNLGIEDGAHTTRRADGSIVENYKEFWYTMVGLAAEGSSFDGNGSYIRAGVGGGAQTVEMGRSKLIGNQVIGNTNLRPLGTSPLYPSWKLPYRLDAPCHTQKLPDVNGPQAGPGPAPPSQQVPTPPPLCNPGFRRDESGVCVSTATTTTSTGTTP